MRKFLKRLSLKISPTWKRKQSIKGTKSPIQDKPKEKHVKAHTNQTNKDKTQRILKAAREKEQVTYKGNPTCLTADLSAETLQARRGWQDIFKVLKGENLQPRLLYLARLSFKIDGEIKSFSDNQKLREFSTTKPALQQMLKGLMQSRNTKEEKVLQNQTPNNYKNGNRNIYINNYFKCKWIKCFNQKTQTG